MSSPTPPGHARRPSPREDRPESDHPHPDDNTREAGHEDSRYGHRDDHDNRD